MRPHGLNLVTIGGGTGLSTLLRGLKRYVDADGAWSIANLGAMTVESTTSNDVLTAGTVTNVGTITVTGGTIRMNTSTINNQAGATNPRGFNPAARNSSRAVLIRRKASS